jgi:glycyl-tRNA synthetase
MSDKKKDSGDLMEKLVALCKRRGFIFQSSEIYGGIGGFWDYGPLGVELKRNIKAAWWEDVVRANDNIVGLDCSIIMNPKVWEASGHVGGFSDPMQTCRQCKKLHRADQVWDQLKDSPWVNAFAKIMELTAWDDLLKFNSVRTIQWAKGKGRNLAPGLAMVRNPEVTISCLSQDLENDPEMKLDIPTLLRYMATEQKGATGLQTPCPNCGGDLTEPREFNLMFKSHAGAMEDSGSTVYLRPETAQGIFANYKNVLDTSRMKLPFGIAQIGKSFRNEINPRNYTFRSREFEQMELEFFCHPDEAEKWYIHWRDTRYQWYIDHGLESDKLHLRDHDPDELAHYARGCADVEYDFPFGQAELEGIANRTDFDLKAHQEHSGRDLTYFEDELWKEEAPKYSADKFDGDKKAAKKAAAEAKSKMPYRFTPFVIEPSGGVDRATLAFLCEAYTEDEAPDDKGNMQTRVVLKLHPRFAPIKVAIFPLVKKDGLPDIAHKLHSEAQSAGLASFYDEKGAVGRRYRRQDEVGTPFCVTVDGQTLEDQTVTVRNRDTLAQERIAIDQVVDYVRKGIMK